jgi:hypothetical protein
VTFLTVCETNIGEKLSKILSELVKMNVPLTKHFKIFKANLIEKTLHYASGELSKRTIV